MDGELRTPGGIVIPPTAISWRFSRATGPGGQGVNTTDSRVELVLETQALRGPADVVARVVETLGPSVRIVAASERSQLRNREVAMARLLVRLDVAAARPRRRRPTRPTRSSVANRLEEKRHQSRIKDLRRGSGDEQV